MEQVQWRGWMPGGRDGVRIKMGNSDIQNTLQLVHLPTVSISQLLTMLHSSFVPSSYCLQCLGLFFAPLFLDLPCSLHAPRPLRPLFPSSILGGSRMVSRQRGSVCVRTCVRVMERRRVGRGLLEESLRGVALYTTLLLASAIRHPTRALVYSSSWSGRGSSSLPGAAPPWL